jgi:lipopolysaccharide export system protein LptC
MEPSPRDRGRAYRKARRHSRLVRWLRIGTLAGIAAVLLSVAAANYLPVGGFRLPGDLGSLVIKGTKITMQQPRLSGFTNDARAYEFTAKTAAQDINKPDFLELQQISAKLAMEDASTVNLTANRGSYDMKTEMLTLNDNIVVVSSTGYEGYLSEAVVDTRKGDVVSEKPVGVKLLNGFLNGKHLEIAEHGDVLRFTGGVSMTLQPGKDTSKAGSP